MSDYDFDLRPLLWLCLFAGLALWGIWELVDYFFIDEVLKSKTLLTPEIKLVIKDNIIDTLYIYKIK